MKSRLTKLFLFLILFSFLSVLPTNSSFTDQETSEGNTFIASALDIYLQNADSQPITTLFDTSDLAPGETITASAYLKSDTPLDFKYTLNLTPTGDTALCSNLDISAKLNGSTQYSGSVTSFSLSSPIYFNSSTDIWEFSVSLNDSSPNPQLKTCSFNLVYSAEQLSGAGFFDTELVTNSISTTDWTPPEATLSVTGSWTKTITEKVTNGDFESGTLDGFTSSGDVSVVASDTIANAEPTTPANVSPFSGGYMARIGSDTAFGNMSWDNRLLQSIPTGAKSLSLRYKIFTRDYTPLDDPAFFIRLNGKEVFSASTLLPNPADSATELAHSSLWREFVADLSNYNSGNINLALYSGNTGDDFLPSWTYIDEITTYLVAAPAHATYHINFSDPAPSSGINTCQYNIDSSGWNTGNDFNIASEGEHLLQYKCSDNAGNTTPTKVVRIITDATAPSPVSDLTVVGTTENSSVLEWTATGNDGYTNKATGYDLRLQKNCSDPLSFNFDTAGINPQTSAPSDPYTTESFELSGLEQNTNYCAGIKVLDEAPNTSSLSNIVTFVTDATLDPASSQDVVINELMWMGSSTGNADEWIELKNRTDRDIDLSGWYLSKLSSLVETPMYTIPTGTIIPAGGYLLISEYDADHSSLKNEPDLVVGSGATNDPDFALSNSELLITLYTDTDTLIDTAGDSGAPAQGLYDSSGNIYYSMERTSSPGDGSDPLNWYTCIDTNSSSDFFDGGSLERGTPGGENRSENAPYSSASTFPYLRLSSSLPESVSFTLLNSDKFSKFTWELSYSANSIEQSITGEQDIDSQQSISVSDIILGSCSTGGACTYQENVTDIRLTLTLTSSTGETKVLTKTYE